MPRNAPSASATASRVGGGASVGVSSPERSSVVDRALQLHGGYGYLQDYPIERFWRDLRVHSILEGTNQIMRVIVSRDLLRQ